MSPTTREFEHRPSLALVPGFSLAERRTRPRRPTVTCATLIPRHTAGSTAGQLRGRPLPTSGRVLLGRAETMHLRIGDPTVSKRHARIEAERGAFWLIDLGSTNGTFVNGAPVVGAVALQDGDVVRFGSVVYNFSSIEAPCRDTRSRAAASDPYEAVTVHLSRDELLHRLGRAAATHSGPRQASRVA